MTPDSNGTRTRTLVALALAALLPAACATMDGSEAGAPRIPEDAVEATRTESNGDVVTEYRVNGALSMVRITPARGPTYYLIDSDGDGRLDRTPQGTRDTPVYFKLYGW
jgi:hypothetical protein